MSHKPQLIVPENHISFTSLGDVRNICSPLFDNTPIDYFLYIRYFPDDSVILLSSSGNVQEYFLSEKVGQIADWETIHTIIGSASNALHTDNVQPCWLVEDIVPNKQFTDYIDKLNICSGIELATQSEEYCEIFWFDSQQGENITNFYLRNFDLLEKFIIYFREKAEKLIATNEKQKIFIPNHNPEFKEFAKNLFEKSQEHRNKLELLNEMLSLKKYPLVHDNKKSYVTLRECEILNYLSQGDSYKEIARQMSISDRTVETRVQNLKNKLDVFT